MRRLWITPAAALLVALPLLAADWPQWLGPNRNGRSPEKGLKLDWPAGGPKVLWRAEGGDGYSSVAVAGGRAITIVQRTTGKHQGQRVLALDAKTGETVWMSVPYPLFKNQYGNGPRSTPTIDGERVYAQLATGELICLAADTGKLVWEVDLLKKFAVKNITWGLSASPLVVGDLVFAVPGAKGAGVAAFDKKTGKLAWKTSDDKAAYATPVAATVEGKQQIVFFNAAGLLAVAPKDGKELWRVPWKTEFDCNIATPLVVGGDKLFVSSGEKVGCTLFQLKAESPPEVIWESKGPKSVMINYWATSIEAGGHLYGLSGEFDKRISLVCVDATTGKRTWTQEEFGLAALMEADGLLFITTKKGDLVLARATPKKYEEMARVRGILGDNRTMPTLSQGRLYLRDREKILCLDVAGK